MNKYFDWPSSGHRLVPFDSARAEDVNGALDELSSGMDSVENDIRRAVKLPEGTAEDIVVNIPPGMRAGKALVFDATGNNLSAAPVGGDFRGDWATATRYLPSETFRDPVSKNIYAVVSDHVSTTVAADLAAGKIRTTVNVVDVEAAKAAAQNAATASANSATASQASAAASAGSAAAANDSKVAAASSAASAATSATTATNQATISATKAGEAAASALAAASSATAAAVSAAAALASESKAKDWAEKAEDSPVESGAFSAKHWAQKAAQSAAGNVIDDGAPSQVKAWSSQKTRDEIDAKEALPVGGTASDVLAGDKTWKPAADLPTGTQTQQQLDAKAPHQQPVLTGVKEVRVAISGGDINLNAGNLFTKTITGAVTLAPINVPPAGTVGAFVLELHNGASAAVTWWGGIVGPPISLTTGRDVFVLYTHDGGATWTRVQVAKGL